MKTHSRLLPVLLALLAGGVAVMAHEGEKHEETPPPPVEVKVVLDSIYRLINQSYLQVEPILRKDCYNCHSDQTKYPWYYKLPLIKGLIDKDIEEGRKHLDLSNGFPFGGHGEPLEDLAAIREEIEEGEMPPWNYRLMHWGSSIEGSARDSLFTWIDSTMDLLRQVYDSLDVPYKDPAKEEDEDDD